MNDSLGIVLLAGLIYFALIYVLIKSAITAALDAYDERKFQKDVLRYQHLEDLLKRGVIDEIEFKQRKLRMQTKAVYFNK